MSEGHHRQVRREPWLREVVHQHPGAEDEEGGRGDEEVLQEGEQGGHGRGHPQVSRI